MTREEFLGIYNQVPNQNLAFDVLNLPDSVASPAERTTAYNAIYNAQRAQAIQGQVASGAPRTIFADDADRYNYRAQLSQQANQQRFVTAQNPRERYIAQLNMSPEIRAMVQEADPQRFNAYTRGIGVQDQVPITPLENLNASSRFRALPLDRQQQIEGMITANPQHAAIDKWKGGLAQDYAEDLMKNGRIEFSQQYDPVSGRNMPQPWVRRKVQVDDPVSGGVVTREQWVEPTGQEKELIARGIASGMINAPRYDEKVVPRALDPESVPGYASTQPARDNRIRRTSIASSNPVQQGFEAALNTPSLATKTYDEYMREQMVQPPNVATNAFESISTGIRGAYEGLGGYGSIPGDVNSQAIARQLPTPVVEDPAERSFYIYQMMRQKGIPPEEIRARMLRAGMPLPKVPRQPYTAPAPQMRPVGPRGMPIL